MFKPPTKRPKMELKCARCSVTSSLMWERNERGELLCNACGKLEAPSTSDGRRKITQVASRKSSRISANNVKNESASKTAPSKTAPSKIRNKKGTPRKICYDPPPPLAKPVFNPVFLNGSYFKHGDIVALHDGELECYAQIRGLLEDQYCEKYAVITWLLPSDKSPKVGFDPDTYIIGYEEEMPRKLSTMTFVSNAPSERYLSLSAKYPSFPPLRAEFGVLYKKTGPEIVRLLPDEEYYNPYDEQPRKRLSTVSKIKLPSTETKKGGKKSKKHR